jgi:peroxiredoxin
MAHRVDTKQAAREARVRAEAETRCTQRRHRLMRHAGIAMVVGIAAVLIVLAVALNGNSSTATAGTTAGPTVGKQAPAFALTDVVAGKQVSPGSLRGHKTLIFFSEGVSCQACMVQIGDLQKCAQFRSSGVRLVSVTTDQPSDLKAAAQQYGITTALLADPTTNMSGAYGMLGHGGMQHPTQDGHAFMLLSADGKVLWHHAYQDMYVSPGQLMGDINARVKDSGSAQIEMGS